VSLSTSCEQTRRKPVSQGAKDRRQLKGKIDGPYGRPSSSRIRGEGNESGVRVVPARPPGIRTGKFEVLGNAGKQNGHVKTLGAIYKTVAQGLGLERRELKIEIFRPILNHPAEEISNEG